MVTPAQQRSTLYLEGGYRKKSPREKRRTSGNTVVPLKKRYSVGCFYNGPVSSVAFEEGHIIVLRIKFFQRPFEIIVSDTVTSRDPEHVSVNLRVIITAQVRSVSPTSRLNSEASINNASLSLWSRSNHGNITSKVHLCCTENVR